MGGFAVKGKPLSRATDRAWGKIGAFEQHRFRHITHFRIATAHDTSKRDRVIGVANEQVIGAQFSVDTV